MRSIILFGVLLALSLSQTSFAGVHAGAALMDEVRGERSSALSISWETEQANPWEFMGGVIRARHGHRLITPQVWFASASKRFVFGRWFAQGGIAATSSDTEVLSGHWQFMTGFGYRRDRFTVSLRHMSNAGTTGRNIGENLLLVQVGF